MKPLKPEIENRQRALFRTELEQIINLEHSLVKLSGTVDWEAFDEEFGKHFC